MKYNNLTITALILTLFTACGGGDQSESTDQTKEAPASLYAKQETDPMKNMGIGPVTELTLPPDIDQAMATTGKEIYDLKCTACHKPDVKHIGPPPKGIFERRTPAWIMNMILNPDEMVKLDPIAKKLLMEYNGSPMANQNLTQEEARAVLEYFRTL